jgi:hypothetical protein
LEPATNRFAGFFCALRRTFTHGNTNKATRAGPVLPPINPLPLKYEKSNTRMKKYGTDESENTYFLYLNTIAGFIK